MDPLKRGGRPRSEEKEEPSGRSVSGESRPELICWKKGWSWQIGVAIPDSVPLNDVEVRQGGTIISAETGARFPIRNLGSEIEVALGDRKKSFAMMAGAAQYLVFKMGKNWSEPGRYVSQLTSGYFLLIAPAGWQRLEVESSNIPIRPENVTSSPICRAHFLQVDRRKESQVGFKREEGEQVWIHSRDYRFDLVGQQIEDDHQEAGSLFVEYPPKICAAGPEVWQSIKTVVCGDEGPRLRGWRDQFSPVPGLSAQSLPAAIGSRSGWYFVRLYDQEENLLDSFDFRFCKRLRTVQIRGAALPRPEGYDPATVELTHEGPLECHLEDRKLHGKFEVAPGEKQTKITVPGDPDCDVTKWRLRDDTGEVSLQISVPRLWWNVADESKPKMWVAETTTVFAEVLAATSKKHLWLRTPQRFAENRIRIGLDAERLRFYPLTKEGYARIPLRDFGDAEEVDSNLAEFYLTLFFDPAKQKVVLVRKDWKVSRLEVVQDNQGEKTTLKFRWKETGRAEEKTIRLKSLSGSLVSFSSVISDPEEAREAEIGAGMEELQPGEYSVEFLGIQETENGSQRKIGLKDVIRVLTAEELLKDSSITLESVSYEDQMYSLDHYEYKIDVMGRIIHGRISSGQGLAETLVKEINDGWYVGRLSVAKRPQGYDMTEDFVQNPIKFEYLASKNRITAIEDRDGDGVVFCPKCGHMVWRNRWQLSEERKGHKKGLVTDLAIDVCAEQPLNH